MTLAAIFGIEGPKLRREEAAFIAEHDPFGIILFARNCESRPQMRDLVSAIADAAGHLMHIVIDQEGGRVQRLKPPEWRQAPPAQAFGDLFATAPDQAGEAAYLNAYLIARELREVGVTINCAPCLDVAAPDMHQAIGDRAFADCTEPVMALGGATIAGLRAGGIWPVMKHLPGHGRARVDSHHATPFVDASIACLQQSDWQPFRKFAGLPLAMTSHIVFSVVDDAHPATQSAAVIQRVIREEIGFSGLLITDDLCMKALAGTPAERAQAAWQAGVDLALHCNGKLEEMRTIAAVAPSLRGVGLAHRPPDPAPAFAGMTRQDLEDRLASIMEMPCR